MIATVVAVGATTPYGIIAIFCLNWIRVEKRETALPVGGWRKDPTGRHGLRYWHGNGWSETVSNNGESSTIPPRSPTRAETSDEQLRVAQGYCPVMPRCRTRWAHTQLGIVLAVALLAAACSDGGGDTSSNPPATASAGDGGPRIVEITTPDGEALAATVALPANSPADTATTVVLAHMRGADRSTWDPLIEDLTAAGHIALAFDFRGYGDSTGTRDTDLDVDLESVVEWARGNSAGPVVLIGASMGGTAALAGGAALEADGVVAMSAPGNFLGLDGTAGAGEIETPILLMVSLGDQPYRNDLAAIADDTGAELVTFPGSAHGTNLFANHDEDATAAILGFLAAIG